MVRQMSKSIFIVLILGFVLFLIPANTKAQDGEYHRERIKDRKEKIIKHREEYRDIIVKKRHYFYREGYFYDRGPKGYVKVVAPLGARIELLPHGYKIVRVHRLRYYLFGGAYYRFFPREKVYVVVKAPL